MTLLVFHSLNYFYNLTNMLFAFPTELTFALMVRVMVDKTAGSLPRIEAVTPNC